MANPFIPTDMRDWCWSSPGIWDWCAGQWETGSDSQHLTLPQPGMAYSNQLCCHLTGHCITWDNLAEEALCSHQFRCSTDAVCSVPFSNSPSTHHGLKDAGPKRDFQLLTIAPGERDQLLRGCRDQEGKITNMRFGKGYGIKLNLLCVARTAAPVNWVTPRSKDCKKQGRGSGGILQALQSPQSCCCRTQHREQRATALADLSWLQKDLSQAQD